MTFALWRFRIALAGHFGYHPAVWAVWDAWQRAEGGGAAFNAWNTTEPYPGATDYNSDHVKNYPSAAAGVNATVATLRNGHYPRMLHYYGSPGRLTAVQIVELCRDDFQTWGTGADNVLRILAT